MTEFEFEPESLYLITHELPVNYSDSGRRADLCRKRLRKCDTGIDNVPTLQSSSSPKCEGFVVPVCRRHGWCSGHLGIQMSFQPVSDKGL